MTLVKLFHISNFSSFSILQINETWALNRPQGFEWRKWRWRVKNQFSWFMLKTETIFSQGIAPSNHFFRQQCLQKSFPPSGPKSYMSLEIGSPSYFFSFKLLIKDNSIAKTFIKQPLSKLFGFQFRKDWDARYICRKFIRLLYFHQNCHHLVLEKRNNGHACARSWNLNPRRYKKSISGFWDFWKHKYHRFVGFLGHHLWVRESLA